MPLCRSLVFFVFALGLATPIVAQTVDTLFDDSILHDIYLEMNPADMQKLRDNYLDNTYYPANLRWRDTVIESVGIRSRGRGSRDPAKPGMRVDFDRYEKGQRFLGMKSVVLDNVLQDRSFIKERIIMSLFRKVEVPASRESHARLFINGVFSGVYVIVEPVDKLFLQTNLGEDGGHLYEYDWMSEYYFEYKGENGTAYVPSPFKPETEESDPKPEELVRFIRFINESSDEDFRNGIGQYLDVNLFARHIAVENYVAEFDGINGYAGVNNFYLYRFKGTTRWQFIPWDKDVTFVRPDHIVMYNIPENVLTRRLWNLPAFQEVYVATLLQLSDIAGAEGGWLDQEIDRIADQIRTAVYSDPNPKCPDSDVSCAASGFEAGISELHYFAKFRNESIVGQLQELELMPTSADASRRR